MKYFKKNTFFIKLKHISIILVLLLLYTFICANSYTKAVCGNISSSVFRLHVIANSNSDEDQNLKYEVRDSIINYMNSIINNDMSKIEVINIANENINELKNIAQKTVQEAGYNYDINVSINNTFFPTKTYGNISLPCGYYDALQIKIGKAEGKNWWCVMFPALCFVDVSSRCTSR